MIHKHPPSIFKFTFMFIYEKKTLNKNILVFGVKNVWIIDWIAWNFSIQRYGQYFTAACENNLRDTERSSENFK